MNKKFVAIIGISGVLMLGSVYSISASTSGYETYKSALKNTHEFQSSTMNMGVSMTDNSSEIFSADAKVKYAGEGLIQISTSMKNESETSSAEMFRQDGQMIIKKDNDEIYYVMEKKQGENFHQKGTEELRQDLEKLVDAATKNIQDNITLDSIENGAKKLDLKLTNVEIPVTANVVTSLMVKHANMMTDRASDSNEFHHVKPQLPDLKKNIQIEEINLEATINKGNYIENQLMNVKITGEDEQGKPHELKFDVEIGLADINDTTVKPLDLTGKKTEIMETKRRHFGH